MLPSQTKDEVDNVSDKREPIALPNLRGGKTMYVLLTKITTNVLTELEIIHLTTVNVKQTLESENDGFLTVRL